MCGKTDIFGWFEAQNVKLKNITADLSVVISPCEKAIIVEIVGFAVELLKIRVSRQGDTVVIEGDGELLGEEKMTTIDVASREKVEITIRMSRGALVELASTFSGNMEIDNGIRVAKEIA